MPRPHKFSPHSKRKKSFSQESIRKKGRLDRKESEQLERLLNGLNTKRKSIGDCMLYCINHSDAANDVIEQIYQSILMRSSEPKQKLAKIFLISDILHNCSAQVTNASYYRGGFKSKLASVFQHMAKELARQNIGADLDEIKDKISTIFKAWKDWTLYEDNFLVSLSNIAMGITEDQASDRDSCFNIEFEDYATTANSTPALNDDLDGSVLEEAQFLECLSSKGFTLDWYKSLGLHDDLDAKDKDAHYAKYIDTRRPLVVGSFDEVDCPKAAPKATVVGDTDEWKAKRAAFKTTKWDTIDPDEVAEQVVTLKNWPDYGELKNNDKRDEKD